MSKKSSNHLTFNIRMLSTSKFVMNVSIVDYNLSSKAHIGTHHDFWLRHFAILSRQQDHNSKIAVGILQASQSYVVEEYSGNVNSGGSVYLLFGHASPNPPVQKRTRTKGNRKSRPFRQNANQAQRNVALSLNMSNTLVDILCPTRKTSFVLLHGLEIETSFASL